MIRFGPHIIPPEQIFFKSKHVLGLVNIKPIVPGHVLLISKRSVPSVFDLNHEEYTELMHSVYSVGPKILKYYGGEGMNISAQDGKAAGQSVPHVHIHLLPRITGDFEDTDEVHDMLEKGTTRRTVKTPEQMQETALELRKLFPEIWSDET